MRLASILVFLSGLSVSSGFSPCTERVKIGSSTALFSSKDDGEVVLAHALGVGTLVEFEEKGRIHLGTIKSAEHKSSGGARYKIEDTEGKLFDIADKAVTFSTPAPNNPGKAEQLLTELVAVQDASEGDLCNKLQVTPELLEMAWEEAADEEAPSHELTAKSFIQLVHSHKASAMEEYMAWKLLKGDMAHVFFKDMKQHGRILSFKAKARKAVDNAKSVFCSSHEDVEFCFV